MDIHAHPVDRRTFVKGTFAVAVAASLGREASAQSSSVTIEIWTDYTEGNDPGRAKAFADAVSLWNSQQPTMQVKATAFDPGEFKTSVPLAVESKKAGWLITADVGSANLLPWYRDGSIVSLQPYADQYGWIAKDTGGAFTVANLGTKPSSTPVGWDIAGLPITYQPLIVFYNKDAFTKNNLTPPVDWDSLIKALDALKAAGSPPLAFGNAAQFHGLHVISSLIASNVSPERLNTWWLGTDPSVKFTDPDFLWACQTARDWAQAGYFTDQFNAVDFQDALGAFMAGQQPAILTGDWNLANINKGVSGFTAGALPFPPHDTSFPWTVVKSPDWPFVMTSWAEDKDAAAKFLDFLTSTDVMNLFYGEAGVQPVFPFDASKVTGSPLQAEVTAAITGKQTGFYVDTVDTEVHSVMWPTSQQLFDGSLSPQDFAQGIQDAHVKSFEATPTSA